MKMIRLVTGICWGIAALALVGVVIWILTGTIFGFGTGRSPFSGISFGINWESLTGPYSAAGAYGEPADGIDSIKVDWIAGSVTVKPYDGSIIQFTEYAQRQLDDDEKLRYEISGGTLTIKYYENKINAVVNMPPKKLEVLVPNELCQDMKKLSIDSASSEVSVESFNVKTLEIESISGAKSLANITADSIVLDSASGRTDAENIVAREMRIKSISGGITLSDADIKTLDCNTTSGSKELSGAFTEVKLHSISGRVSISSKVVPESLRIDTTSGGVTIAIPDEGAITVNHSSTSGKLTSDIPITIHGKDAQFSISTVSGAVKIVVLD